MSHNENHIRLCILRPGKAVQSRCSPRYCERW